MIFAERIGAEVTVTYIAEGVSVMIGGFGTADMPDELIAVAIIWHCRRDDVPRHVNVASRHDDAQFRSHDFID